MPFGKRHLAGPLWRSPCFPEALERLLRHWAVHILGLQHVGFRERNDRYTRVDRTGLKRAFGSTIKVRSTLVLGEDYPFQPLNLVSCRFGPGLSVLGRGTGDAPPFPALLRPVARGARSCRLGIGGATGTAFECRIRFRHTLQLYAVATHYPSCRCSYSS